MIVFGQMAMVLVLLMIFKFMPIRIDYLFNSRTINVNNFKIYSEILSDHRPISVFLDI